jgi:hypothetical protein
MELNKTSKYTFLVLLVATAAFAIYGWLDTSVSLDHARQQQKTDRERSELLRDVMLRLNSGAQRAEVMRLMRQNFSSGHVIKDEQDRIVLDDIVFRFDDKQSLSKIQFLSSGDD